MIDPNDHIGLILSETSRQRALSPWVEWDEIHQVAAEAVVIASQRFDESLGFQFSSYAVQVIRNNMRDFLRRHYVNRGITYAPTDDWATKCHCVDFSYDHDEGGAMDPDSYHAVCASAVYPKEYPVTRDQLQRALATLEPEEVGSLDFSLTGVELGERFGVTKQAVNLWRHRALRKLREYFDVPPEDYEGMPILRTAG